METQLIDATHLLTNNIKNHPNKPYLKNILCLLMIYFKLNMLHDFCHKPEHTTLISILLQNLAVNPSMLETEVKNFWNGYGELFQESLLGFVNDIISHHSSLTAWIFAIPIVHLLMKQRSSLNSVEWHEDPSKFRYVFVVLTTVYQLNLNVTFM